MSVLVQISHEQSGAAVDIGINTHDRFVIIKRDVKGKAYETIDVFEATKANMDILSQSIERLKVHAV